MSERIDMGRLSEGVEHCVHPRELPLPDVLLWAQEDRFTGVLRLGQPRTDADRLFYRNGSLHGVERPGELGRTDLGEALVALRSLEKVEVAAFAGAAKDAVELAQLLVERGLVTRRGIEQAASESGRRRLFGRSELGVGHVWIRRGLKALGHFNPTYVDPRPAIAYGLVMQGDAWAKRTMLARIRGRRARLLAPYDMKRNAYGLPPAVGHALRRLEGPGIYFGDDTSALGLPAEAAAGVLLWLDRIQLLEVYEMPVSASSV